MVYLSTTIKLPSERNHDQKKFNPKQMVVISGDYDPSFRDEFLYLMLKSDAGCTVRLTAMFPEIKNRTRVITPDKMSRLPSVFEKDMIAKFSFEPLSNEIVIQNTCNAEKWKTIKHAKFSKKICSNREKMEKAKVNKRAIEEKHRQDNIEALNKWAVFRKKREQVIIKYVKVMLKKRSFSKLFKILGLRSFLKTFLAKLKAKIKKVIYKLQSRFIGMRVRQSLHRMISHQFPEMNMEDRVKRRI